MNSLNISIFTLNLYNPHIKYNKFMKYTIWCLPFAGASYYSYRPLFKSLENTIHVKYLELPGRGNRVDESLCINYHKMLDDLYDQIAAKVTEPFVLFGHSMGAQLAYDITCLLEIRAGLKPDKLVVSGRGAPHSVEMKQRHDLPKNEFKQELKQLGGVPKEIIEDQEFFSFFEPILRADFQAIEDYVYTGHNVLNVPILALLGDNEETTENQSRSWSQYTNNRFHLEIYKGGHFFLFDHVEEILKLIERF